MSILVGIAVGALAVWVAGRKEWMDQADLLAVVIAVITVVWGCWWFRLIPPVEAGGVTAVAVLFLVVFAHRALAVLGIAAAVGGLPILALIVHGSIDPTGPPIEPLNPSAEVAVTP